MLRNVIAFSLAACISGQDLPTDRERAKRIERLVEITNFRPSDVGSWHDLATLYREASEWDKAIDAETRAIQRHPKYAVAYYGRAKAAMGKRDFPSARADFSAAIGLWELRGGRDKFLTVERPPEPYIDSYRTRGMAWANEGNLGEGIADLGVAVELAKDDALLQWERAYLYEKAKMRAEASSGYLRAGLLYADSRRFDKAAECAGALDRLAAAKESAELRARMEKARKPASDLPD